MKRVFVYLVPILVLIIICTPVCFAESIAETIDQKLSPLDHRNADKIIEKIEQLVYNASDYPEIEVRYSDRTLNKGAAFHCYRMTDRSYSRTWLKSGKDAVFADAEELTIIPVCDDGRPSGYISIREKEDSEDGIEVRGPRMNGKAYMPWMKYLVDRSGFAEFLNENGITSLSDIRCVLGREDLAPDFIYLDSNIGEYVISYFSVGGIGSNGELLKLENFLDSYDRYVTLNEALQNDPSSGREALSADVIRGIALLVVLVLSVVLYFILRQ